MFYKTEDGHGLPHNPFKAIVTPRPIGWISSRSKTGRDNLAPYSFFNGVNDDPPMVMFCTSSEKLGIDEEKDSLVNIRDTGVFCVNFVAYDMRDAMNISSGHYDHGKDEFALAELEKAEAREINAPYVVESPAVFECKLHDIIDLPGGAKMVIGAVVATHLQDKHIVDGIFDVTSYKPLARLGYRDYAVVREVFSLQRPK